METHTKKHLAAYLAKLNGISRQQALVYVNSTLRGLVVALLQHKRVEIRGLGVFTPFKRRAPMGRNFSDGSQINIPDAVVARFKPSRTLTKRMNRKRPAS